MEKKIWNSKLHILWPEMNSSKSFDVFLDISSVYNIYGFQVKHFSNKKDLKHWKLKL
jgi:hypothetical protein